MNVLVYCRVSRDAKGLSRSTEEQEAECRAWADREGWTITQVISEKGSAARTAKSTAARTRWKEVTTALESGEVGMLMTWEASRATRDLTVYAALRDLCAKQGVLWGYSGTVYDLGARSDRFRTGLDALVSEDESARISERIQRSVRSRAAAGRPHGRVPYGYRREYDSASGQLLRQVPDEETAPIVRELFTRIAAGDGLRTMARDLTTRGVLTPRPPEPGQLVPWVADTVKTLVENPAYAGLRVHRKEIIGDAGWEPLVPVERFEEVQAILADPTRLTRIGDSRTRHLLTGIARCGVCTTGVMRFNRTRGRDFYVCKACFRVTRRAEPVDDHVRERAIALLGLIDVAPAAAVSEDLVQAQAELLELTTRLDGFIDQGSEGKLSPRALARIEARLTPQIRALEQTVRAGRIPSALAGVDLGDPVGWWNAATLEQRRDLLRRAFRVTIHPAGRGKRNFDPDLVVVVPTW